MTKVLLTVKPLLHLTQQGILKYKKLALQYTKMLQ